MQGLRGLFPGVPREPLEPWREKFVEMFTTTGMSVASGFGAQMSQETMAAMKLQIGLMVAELPIEYAREMLQMSIWQATEVLKLMTEPVGYDASEGKSDELRKEPSSEEVDRRVYENQSDSDGIGHGPETNEWFDKLKDSHTIPVNYDGPNYEALR